MATIAAFLLAGPLLTGSLLLGAADPAGAAMPRAGDSAASPSSATVPTAGLAATTLDDALVEVHLANVAPVAPTAGDTLVISGSITNVSAADLTALNAYLRMSAIPVKNASDLDRIDDPTFRGGFRTAFFAPAGDTLAAGSTTTFRLEAPLDELPFAETGVYVVGVEVRATEPSGSRTSVGQSLTVLPYAADVAKVPSVGIAWAWPLTAAVDRDADGTFRSDDLGAQLEASGTLGGAMVAAGTAPVTWFVDPAVVRAAADMAGGYEVVPRTPTSETNPSAVPGAHQAAAEAWLDAVRNAATAGRVEVLPYGNVDVVALTRAGLTEDVASALTLRDLSDVVPGALDDLLLPPGGAIDPATLAVVGGAGVRHVVVSSDSLAAPSDGTTLTPRVRLSAAGKNFVGLRVETPGVLTSSSTADGSSDIQQRQLFLSRAALAGWGDGGAGAPSTPADQASEPATPSTFLVLSPTPTAGAPGLVSDLLDLTKAVPWLTAVPLETATTGAFGPATLAYPAAARAAELSPSYLSLVSTLTERIGVLASLTGGLPATLVPSSEPAPSPSASGSSPAASATDEQAATLSEDRRRLVLRSESAAWRPQQQAARTVVTAQTADIEREISAVHVATSGTITLSSTRGRFPLTVRNGLDEPVVVQVELTPREPGKFRAAELPTVAIAAGELATVDVSAEAGSNGTFVVDVQLRAPNGAVLGPPTTLTVRATDYDTVAWLVIIVAGGLLFLAAGFRIARRVVRARRAASTPT